MVGPKTMPLPEGLKSFARAWPIHSVQAPGQVPLVFRPTPGHPTTTLLFCMRAGVRYESAQHWGASHFLEHILMRGTDRYPTLFDLTRRIESLGGRISAYSTRDLTAFWVKLPPGQEPVALEVLTQVLFHPTLAPEFIEAERAIIRQERLRERHNPAAFVSQAIESLLLQPSPLSRHPIGEDGELARMTPEFIRSFLDQYYHRSNLVIAAAGNLSANLPELVRRATDALPDGPPAREADFLLDSPLQGKSVVLHPSASREQVFLGLGWSFPVSSRRELVTWRVVNTLLGAGYTSLLNQCLREQESLTYVCSTALNTYAETGLFKMHMALAERDLEQVLERVQGILDDLAGDRVPDDLFREAAVRHAAGIVLRWEDSLEVARLLGQTFSREGEPFRLDRYLEEVEAVTREEASELARRFLTPNRRRALLHGGSPRLEKLFPEAGIYPTG